MAYFFVIFSLVLGSIIGSFLNVVILRLPAERSLGGRSSCPHCGHELSAMELIPVVSYIGLGGRCRSCKRKISSRYCIVELITSLLFAAAYLMLPESGAYGAVHLAMWWAAISLCVAIFIIDLEQYLIFDSLVFLGLFTSVLGAFILDLLGGTLAWSFSSLFVSALLGAVSGAAPFFLIWLISRGEWMGFGDVKFMLFAGAAAGFPLVFLSLLLSVLAGGAVSGFLLLFAKKTLKSRIPFGTFLTGGLVLTLLFGDQLWRWYVASLGF